MDIFIKKIHLLKKAYLEELPERTESGFNGWLVRAIPVLGSIYAVSDRNQIVKELKVKDELAVILQAGLENCILKVGGLENKILAMQEQLRSMEENHTAKLESMEERNVETAREHQTQLRSMEQNHIAKLNSMESNFSKAFEVLSKQISSLKTNNQERGENWEMMIVNKEEVGRGL